MAIESRSRSLIGQKCVAKISDQVPEEQVIEGGPLLTLIENIIRYYFYQPQDEKVKKLQ